MNEDHLDQFDVWYNPSTGEDPETIRVAVGRLLDAESEGRLVKLDIRDAVYFRYLLDGAINDYERAVGR
jgi:hypothetical protein